MGTRLRYAMSISRVSSVSTLSPASQIFFLAAFSRMIHLLILHLCTKALPLFDTSPSLILGSPPTGLRWDVIHFASIASRGYEYEQQLAFQPGWLGVMRLAGETVRLFRRGQAVDVRDVVIGGMIVANAAFIGSSVMLYKVTARLFDPTFAFVTSLLYLLPPTVTPSAAYTEPLYALMTFTGIYILVAGGRTFMAGLCFAAATSIRTTGVFNAAVVMLSGILKGEQNLNFRISLVLKRMWKPLIPSIMVIAPFLAFQYYAKVSFCDLHGDMSMDTRPWCSHRPPISYGTVQKLYWNIGPFEYWTLGQLPNIALALPILASSVLGSSDFLRIFLASSAWKRSSEVTAPPPPKPILIGLYCVHGLTMALLLFASHTQIALRVCLGDPVTWWNVARFAFDWKLSRKGGRMRMTKLGRWWVTWTVVWGSIATVLWAGHYPPA